MRKRVGMEMVKTYRNMFAGFFYRRPGAAYAGLSGIAAVFLCIFFGYPLTRILKIAFFNPDLNWDNFRIIFKDPHGLYLHVFFTTFRIAGIVTLLTLFLGYPLAALLVHAKGRWRQVITICVLLPFWTSVLVRSYAWMILLGRRGLVNSLLMVLGLIDTPVQLVFNSTGTIIAMTHIMLPYMVFPLYSVMNTIDAGLIQAAYNLGAKPWQAFLKIFFPLTLPGVFGGGLIVFVVSLGFFITPVLLGGQKDIMVAVLIERQVMETMEWGLSAALSLILLTATLLLAVTVRRFMKVEGMFEGGR